MNLLVMSLVSAAALSFTSCSSNDDLAGNAGQEKVDGFYMTLTVQSPNASGTRTSVLDPTENATAGEAAIKNGTLYLVDDKNNIAFHEDLSNLDWSGDVKDDASKRRMVARLTKSRFRKLKQVRHIVYISWLVTTSQHLKWTSQLPTKRLYSD